MLSKIRKFLKLPERHVSYSKQISSLIFANPDLYTSSKNIYKLFNLYQKWVRSTDYRSRPFEQEVLHYIIERLFWLDFSDLDFVSNVLHSVYDVQNHYGYILSLGPENYTKTIDDEYRLFFTEFFLKHTNKTRITMKGSRIFDLSVNFRSSWLHPCEVAVLLCSPEVLHLLLRYGSLATDQNQPSVHCIVYTDVIQKSIIHVIKAILGVRNPYIRFGDDALAYNNIVTCGKLLLRVCPQLQNKFVFFRRISCNTELLTAAGYSQGKSMSISTVMQMIQWVAVVAMPELKYRIFMPMSLKHACRLSIRKALYDRWQLPNGIQKLPLPHILKQFLDLYVD